MPSSCKIQAIVDLSLELNKFVNISLFQRGWYQLRVTPKIPLKVPHRVEINHIDTPNFLSKYGFKEGKILPPCIIDGSAVSKTFPITYKNEEIAIDDNFNIKIILLLSNDYVNEINETPFPFEVSLWFSDAVNGPHRAQYLVQVASRQIVIHFDTFRGLHYHLPLIFDYFHLSSITLTLHGSLISLCFPFINSKVNPDFDSLKPARALLLHWQLCSILNIVIIKLRKKLKEYLNLLPPWVQARFQKIDTTVKLENLSPLAQKCYLICQESYSKLTASSLTRVYNHELSLPPKHLVIDESSSCSSSDHLNLIESDIAHICSYVVVLWQSFLKLVTRNEKIIQYLAKVHHSHRIKRFSEAFFTTEKPRKSIYSLCDQNSSLFSDISEKLRSSAYLLSLPLCDVECAEMDGNAETLPIIFEEQFDQEILSSSTSASSLCDIFFEETASLLATDYSNFGKRNFREKFFNNFNRLNFGYGRSKEEYSPVNLNSHSRRVSSSLMTSASATEISSPVNLHSFRRFNDETADVSPELKSENDHNTSDLKSKIKSSESLPDLNSRMAALKCFDRKRLPADSFSSINESGSPPRSASSIEYSSRSISSTNLEPLEKNFRGTAYFPKSLGDFANGTSVSPKVSGITSLTEGLEDVNDEVFLTEISKPQSPVSQSSSSSSGKALIKISENIKVEPRKATIENERCTILELLKNDGCLVCPDEKCTCFAEEEPELEERIIPSLKRLSAITPDLIAFVENKELFREQFSLRVKGYNFYSDFSSLASRIPYFQCDSDLRAFSTEGLHLVVCVHGLGGNSGDLRLVKTYLKIGLPTTNFEFLMSKKNQGETFECFQVMTDRLVQEINYHIEAFSLNPAKISFIGHSLGNVIIRACIARPEMTKWRPKFHTFLSLSGPHLGTAYNNNGLVNMGLWFMQKLKKSESLLQLSMKDSTDPRKTYLYKLSQERGLEYFKYVLLCGSSQDHYVPIHSAHIELSSSALNDSSILGICYREMVFNILHPLMIDGRTKLVRYDAHFPATSVTLLGRAAHIAVLDSELFIEKFMVVVGLKYFA